MQRRRLAIGILGALVGMAGCSDADMAALFPGTATPKASPSAGAVTGLSSVANQITLGLNESRGLMEYIRTQDGLVPRETLEFTSSDPAVVSVEQSGGYLRAIARGSAKITVVLLRDPKVRAEVYVTVAEQQLVSSVEVDPAAPSLAVGDSLTLTARVHLADGQINSNVVWSSSDDTVATVNSTNGQVTALKTGTVTIVAAYALDPHFKGLSSVTIVADRSLLPPIQQSTVPTVNPSGEPIPGASQAPSGPQGQWVFQTSGTVQGLKRIFLVDAQTGFAVGSQGTFLKTDNGGGKWTDRSPATFAGKTLTALGFASATHGWVGTEGSIYVTTDGGDSWSEQLHDDNGFVQILIQTDQEEFAVSANKLYHTTDGGANWQAETVDPVSSISQLLVVGGRKWIVGDGNIWTYVDDLGWVKKSNSGSVRTLDFTSQNDGWYFDASGDLLYHSTDGGNNWFRVELKDAQGQALSTYRYGNLTYLKFFNAQVGVLQLDAVLFVTKDGGQSWQQIPAAGGVQDLQSVTFLDAEHGWAAGSYNGGGLVIRYAVL